MRGIAMTRRAACRASNRLEQARVLHSRGLILDQLNDQVGRVQDARVCCPELVEQLPVPQSLRKYATGFT